jgi:hypothetical protein
MTLHEQQTIQGQQTVTHLHARQVLRRAGFSAEQIDQILGQLPDPFDLDSDGSTLQRLGLTHDRLVDRMGGSP